MHTDEKLCYLNGIAIKAMPEHRLAPLMQTFGEMVEAQQLCVAIFGIL